MHIKSDNTGDAAVTGAPLWEPRSTESVCGMLLSLVIVSLSKAEYRSEKNVHLLFKASPRYCKASHVSSFCADIHGPDSNKPDSAAQLYVTARKSDLELFKEPLPFPMSESRMCPIRLSDSFVRLIYQLLELLITQFHTVELYLYQNSLHGRYGDLKKIR